MPVILHARDYDRWLDREETFSTETGAQGMRLCEGPVQGKTRAYLIPLRRFDSVLPSARAIFTILSRPTFRSPRSIPRCTSSAARLIQPDLLGIDQAQTASL